MYVYDLSVAMSDRDIVLQNNEELISAIKEAIDISNHSFSATRYKRTLEFIDFWDEKHMHLRMKSRDEINPTRSLSSLSRALVQNEKSKGSNLLEGHLVNGCVFNATVIPKQNNAINSADELSDSDAIQILVKMALRSEYSDIAEDTLRAVKEILIQNINGVRE